MTDPWSLVYSGFDPAEEGLREALCTLGNGYVATRGAAPESTADDVHYPGTYVAGLYDRLTTEIAGRRVENEDLVNVPNWLALTLRVDGGAWLDLGIVEVLDHHQELELRRGVLARHVRFADDRGRVTILTQRRLVSMRDPHLLALESTVVAENWSGTLEVLSCLDGRVTNAGVARYRELRGDHLVLEWARPVDEETVALVVQTRGSDIRIAQAARTRLVPTDASVHTERRLIEDEGVIGHGVVLEVEEGVPITVEKVVGLYTSRDRAMYEPGVAALSSVRRAGGFEDLLARHVLAWDHLWRRFDVRIEGPDRAQLVLRLHAFHLLQTVSVNTIDLDVGVPARGLHGEAYRGHVFWDELFIFPFLNMRLPILTRTLLDYRHRRLAEARAAAEAAGYRGAMYPWQSGSDGREETQTLHLNPRSGRWLPDRSRLQRHINVAVAYNVWQYFQATGDLEFLRFRGGPMLLEIASFWASIARYNRALDRYEICGVVGPDEYHDSYPGAERPGLDNNAYTNVMAAWVLCRALDLPDLLAEHRSDELLEHVGISRVELELWEDVSRKMHVPFLHDGIPAQFEGYGDLAELDWEDHAARYGDIQRLDRILEAEGDTANRYKASKQADVLMLFYLLSSDELTELLGRLGYAFDPAVDIPRTIQYYLDRTSHGSTLSRLVHSWVLARLDRERSWEWFVRALESDVADVQGGTTREGIHLGAMAGTIDLVQRCYGGVETRGGVLWLDPALPTEIEALEFSVHYRGQRLDLRIAQDVLRVSTRAGVAPPIRINLRGEMIELGPGETREVAL